MISIHDWINTANTLVLSPSMVLFILSVGTLLTVRLAFLPLRRIGFAFKLLWQGRHVEGKGDISPFRALMTSLAATIGIGNIAGVATAISLGGPGALFWMWMSALVGMATKFAEAVLAVHFREVDASGKHIGGPMYYIKNGLTKRWHWLAMAFALFGAVAAFGIGNLVQSNSIAAALDDFGVHPALVSGVVVVLVGVVLLGGIQRISAWASFLVPFLAIFYIGSGLVVLAFNIENIPTAMSQILTGAFTGTAATGGFVGAAVWMAIRFGIVRGVFSNEAGLGSAPIAHAAAATVDPVRQGTVAMLGTFIDTLVVCSITGLAIVSTGVWKTGLTGVDLTSAAFSTVFDGGQYMVSFALIVFGFTTILGWSYYGEKCWQYLFGLAAVKYYRIAFVLATGMGPLALLLHGGAEAGITLVWLIADMLNALMALPNLIAIFLLLPVVVRLAREYYQKIDGAPAD